MLPDVFFMINFSFDILISTISLSISLLTIFIVYKNRRFRTINNILTCNTSVAAIYYSLITIITSIPGFHEDWALNAPLCSVRAYCFNLGIATICHSKSMHSISRLFFTVFYKHRYLLSWRVHRIMIILSWIIGGIICIPPFFVAGGYALEKESRSCVISSKVYLLALYITIISCFIPFTIILIVYLIILFHVHRSTRRVFAFNQNTIQKSRREIKLMKQMVIQTNILIAGGPIFIFLIGWHAITEQPAPEPLYLLGFTLITTVASLIPIVQFITNEQIKQAAVQYFRPRRARIIILKPRPQQQQLWHMA